MATELEIMVHAKRYIDQLANGINPLTGEVLPETDIVNQVRISRCLFYVSDILRQTIEKGGLRKASSGKMLPFQLTEEQRNRFEFFDSPVPVSAITDRLNSLIDHENMKKLGYRNITSFLEKEGFLIQFTDLQGKTKRSPTEQGAKLGICSERRSGLSGEYTVVLYDLHAQHYIMDHLDQILATPPSAGKQSASPHPAAQDNPETKEIMSDPASVPGSAQVP